jgi:hypothetical protein
MLKGYEFRQVAIVAYLNKYKYWPENAENISEF